MASITGTSQSSNLLYTTADGQQVYLPKPGKLDPRALLEGQLAPKQRAIDTIDTKFSTEAEKLVQLKSLEQKVDGVVHALKELANHGSYNAQGSIYTTLNTSNPVIREAGDPTLVTTNYIAAAYTSGAPATPLEVTIDRVATRSVVQSATMEVKSTISFTDTDTQALSAKGIVGGDDLVIERADRAGNVTIALNTAWTLDDLISAINDETADTGVTASAVSDGDGGYVIKFVTSAMGQPINFADSDANTVSSLGLVSKPNITFANTATETLDDKSIGAGTLKIAKADGSGNESISLTTSDTLSDVMSKINAVKSTTKVEASFQKFDDTHYFLVLTSTETGVAIDFADTASSVLTDLGLANADGTYTASVHIKTDPGGSNENVVTYTSTSNTIDLGDGRAITVKAADSDKTFRISPSTSTTRIMNDVKIFIAAYNEAIAEIQWQEGALERNGDDKPLLEKESVFKEVRAGLAGFVSTIIPQATAGYRTPADMGITKFVDPTHESLDVLMLDEDKFQEVLDNHYDEVKALFMNAQTLAGDDAANYTLIEGPRKTGLALDGQTVSVTMDYNDGSYRATFSVAGYDDETVTIDATNKKIIGPVNTVFEGISFNYTGSDISTLQSTAENITLNFELGLMGKFYQQYLLYTNDEPDRPDGSIVSAEKTVAKVREDLQTRQTQAKETFAKAEEKILAKLAKLTSLLQTLEITKQRFSMLYGKI